MRSRATLQGEDGKKKDGLNGQPATILDGALKNLTDAVDPAKSSDPSNPASGNSPRATRASSSRVDCHRLSAQPGSSPPRAHAKRGRMSSPDDIKQLAPTGRLRGGVVVAPAPSAFFAIKDDAARCAASPSICCAALPTR